MLHLFVAPGNASPSLTKRYKYLLIKVSGRFMEWNGMLVSISCSPERSSESMLRIMFLLGPYLFHSLFLYKPDGQKWMDGAGQLPGMEGYFSRGKIFSGKGSNSPVL